ncbi:Dinoflagellate viral nucleoprotein 5 (DNVP5) [Durusdinium trenchii]|uniref:Dinoflagellate viral nucleoprotein 5 (DNVP5) n=1 Tax=Durusdinium trenchii TaxID=1381693 RepID=A0ABP0K3F1_9DINO
MVLRKDKLARPATKSKNTKKRTQVAEAAEQKLKRKAIARRKKTSQIARPKDWKRGVAHAYRLVATGRKKKTSGGLTKQDIIQNKRGRYVSKKRHFLSQQSFTKNRLDVWLGHVMQSRREVGAKGFVAIKKPVKGKPATISTDLYVKTLEKWMHHQVATMNQRLMASGSEMRVAKAVEVKPPDSNDVPTPTKFRTSGAAGSGSQASPAVPKRRSEPGIPWPWKS